MIETNKLKQDISSTSRFKKDTLLELGTKVYELNKEGVFQVEVVEDLITKIAEAEAKVADLEAKIQLIQDEEKAKLDEINTQEAEAAVSAPVDAASTEVEATPVAPVAPAEPVAPVAPVGAEVSAEDVEVEIDETTSESGEYKG